MRFILFALPIASGFMVATPYAVQHRVTPMSPQMRAPPPTPSPTVSLAAVSAFLATPSGQLTAVAAIFGGAYFAKRRADYCDAKDGCDLVGGIMEDAAAGVDAISTLIGEEKEEAEAEPQLATAPDTSWRRSYS